MRSGPHRLLDRHGSPWRLLAIAAAVASLLGPVAIAAAASPMDVPYSSASSGNLEVTLPSAYPDVQLSLVGNQTVAADLAISQILESTPSSSTPQIVAVALPSNVVVTNATGAAQSAGLLFTLTASLTVYPSNAGLWQGPGDLVQPNGAPLGTAHLAINYSQAPSTSTSGGVATSWGVSGWPWVASSDLLGVQLSLSTPFASSEIACTGAPSSLEQAGCPGTTLFGSPGLWSSRVLGVQGHVAGGPTALVSWGSGFSTSVGPSSPVSAGVLAGSASTSHLVLAAPGNGASSVSGSVSFALLSTVTGIAGPLLVHAQSSWYFAGIAASALGGLVGIGAFRRRQQKFEQDL